MKGFIFSLLLLLYTLNLFGQAPPPHSLDLYLQKNQEHQRAGWILLAGGTTMVLAGMAIRSQESTQDMGYGSSHETGMWLMGAGVLLDLASIPFFISAARNAKKAATLSLSQQALHINWQSNPPFKIRPAITLTLAIR